MAGQTSAKRARANTAGDTLAQPIEIRNTTPKQASEQVQSSPTEQEIQLLAFPKVAGLLKKAAEMHPDVNALVADAIKQERDKRQAIAIDFDSYSSAIWKSINITYRSLSGSKQFDIAWDVVGNITSAIGYIAGKCDALSSPQTRLNGLSVLRKIGKTICLSSNDTLGHEVQKQFQSDPSLENAMHDIVSEMSLEERKRIMEGSDPESLWEKLQELEGLANDHCVFEGLRKVLDLIEGKEGEGDGLDDDEEDEEDYQDEDEYGKSGDERDIC